MVAEAAAMLRAIELGWGRMGLTWPNPAVGAVVLRDGRIVAEGATQAPGQDHAEPDALRKLGFRAEGATLVVTLEPCCHWGRTPPCTDAILRSGLRRVVVGTVDPNPVVAGKGIAALREAGLEVEVGVLEEACRGLHEAHIVRATEGRPFVTAKAAVTLDGRTATRTGESQWITGPAARAHGRRQRGLHQAVAVGVQTVLADDPALNVRDQDARWLPQPIRVVFDSQLRTPPDARLLAEPGGPVWLVTTAQAPPARAAALRARGARLLEVPATEGRVDPLGALAALAREQITALFVEGGPTLLGALADAGLIDRWLIYIAPTIFGGEQARPALGGLGVAQPADARRLAPPAITRLGDDILLETRPMDGPGGPWWATQHRR